MVLTVLKTTYQKAEPTVVIYRDYKNLSEQTFKQDLREELEIIKSSYLNYDSFQNCFEKVLDKHASIEKKCARANDGPFMNGALVKPLCYVQD